MKYCQCENSVTATPCIVCGKPKLINREWFERMVEKEGNLEIGVGVDLSSDLIERAARAISLSQGEDPDADAELYRICTADNKPVPNWRFYEEHASAALLSAPSSSHPNPLSSIIPATKGGEDAIKRAWEYGRNSWCPAGILRDKERTERDWREALAALSAQDTDGVAKP